MSAELCLTYRAWTVPYSAVQCCRCPSQAGRSAARQLRQAPAAGHWAGANRARPWRHARPRSGQVRCCTVRAQPASQIAAETKASWILDEDVSRRRPGVSLVPLAAVATWTRSDAPQTLGAGRCWTGKTERRRPARCAISSASQAEAHVIVSSSCSTGRVESRGAQRLPKGARWRTAVPRVPRGTRARLWRAPGDLGDP